jgi:hypothetical protein
VASSELLIRLLAGPCSIAARYLFPSCAKSGSTPDAKVQAVLAGIAIGRAPAASRRWRGKAPARSRPARRCRSRHSADSRTRRPSRSRSPHPSPGAAPSPARDGHSMSARRCRASPPDFPRRRTRACARGRRPRASTARPSRHHRARTATRRASRIGGEIGAVVAEGDHGHGEGVSLMNGEWRIASGRISHSLEDCCVPHDTAAQFCPQ